MSRPSSTESKMVMQRTAVFMKLSMAMSIAGIKCLNCRAILPTASHGIELDTLVSALVCRAMIRLVA